MDQVSAQLRNFIVGTFPLARNRKIQDNDPLLESGIIDSLGVLGLVGFVESTFGVPVSDEDLVPENFQTIERLTTFVHQRLGLDEATDRDRPTTEPLRRR